MDNKLHQSYYQGLDTRRDNPEHLILQGLGFNGRIYKEKPEKDGDYTEKDLKQGKGMEILEYNKDKNCIVLDGK